MSDVLVKVENLSCQAGSVNLLHNINWEIKRGEQWVVFGRNGCGKTTLLSIIAGYKSFSSGKLEVFGEEYTKENILELRKKIGWISSSFFDKIYTRETVLDIVLSGTLGSLGLDFDISSQDVIKARNLLIDLGLKSKLIAPFDTLSKGERQQVLIARAFMTQPELLILDEPGTGLDALARERLLVTIGKLAKDTDITIIFVTHYPEEILPSFDNCLLLRNSAIYKIGKTREIFTSETISDFFNHPVTVEWKNEKYDFAIPSDALDSFI